MVGEAGVEIAKYFESSKKVYKCVKHLIFKQADGGLYAGETLRFGTYSTNMKNKIKRTWHPNTHFLSFHSEILDTKLRVKVTPSAMQKINKEGCIDDYILEQDILESSKALQIKILLMKKLLSIEIKESKT